jgi:hypothetical protein
MLEFSSPLVFAQQDHLPLKEYGVREVTSSDYARMKKSCLSSHQKEQLKDGYINPHKTKLTSAQKD